MSEILHANIFFFIASAATVIFSLLVCMAMYHVIKILKIFRVIMERIEAGSEMIAEDVAHIRGMVASGGVLSKLVGFIMSSSFGSGRKRKARQHDED